METLYLMAVNVILFVAYAVPGFLLLKFNVLKKQDSLTLSNLVVYIGVPFLFIFNLMKTDFSGDTIYNLIVCICFSIIVNILYYLFAKLITKKISPEKRRGMATFSIAFSNGGFLGVPLAAAVFDKKPQVVLFVFIFMLINNILLWTAGVYEISRKKELISVKKALLNPLIISIVVGVLFVLLNVAKYLPPVYKYSEGLAALVTPLSMMVLGMKFADTKFINIFKNKVMYLVSFFRLLISPLLIMSLLFLLSEFITVSSDVFFGVFIASAVPGAALSTTFADKYDGDVVSAVEFTLGSTILSVITLPLLFWLLNMLL